MTLHTWLKNATTRLEAQNISSSRIDSELILAHILEKDRAYLIAHVDDTLSSAEEAHATELLERRLKNEPMAFLLNSREFYNLTFKTDRRALIPRGESEPLVETAIEWLQNRPESQIVAEIGTGSGALIISVAKAVPTHTFLATEISPEALSLAKENAELHQASINFFEGNLGEPLLTDYAGSIHLLMTNLPYIATDLLTNLDPTVTYYEPNLALDGGGDGLNLYRQFLPHAKQLLTSGGLLLCEHEHDHSEMMRELVREQFPDAVIKTVQDSLGHDRLLVCQT
ncbi:MAG TPA: peptide chain release factor N(5)-glutamine methyltransferase [Patescibacteria group bacterium]